MVVYSGKKNLLNLAGNREQESQCQVAKFAEGIIYQGYTLHYSSALPEPPPTPHTLVPALSLPNPQPQYNNCSSLYQLLITYPFQVVGAFSLRSATKNIHNAKSPMGRKAVYLLNSAQDQGCHQD
jgi:hypothetical protein